MMHRLTGYLPEDLDPVVLTERLNVAKNAREAHRRRCIDRTGEPCATPIFDASIDHLEYLLSAHLPHPPDPSVDYLESYLAPEPLLPDWDDDGGQ